MINKLRKKFDLLTNQLKDLELNDLDTYKKLWEERVNIRLQIINLEKKVIQLQKDLVCAMELGDTSKEEKIRLQLKESGCLTSEEIDSLKRYV